MKACSLDPWPAFLLSEIIDILILPITNIINVSLRDGVFPHQFKEAIITPLIKKPSLCKEELPNYRPVSNLCYISKLLERIVASQLNQHLKINNLVNPLQSAY